MVKIISLQIIKILFNNMSPRTYSVVTKEKNLETLYTINNFPAYMGCVPSSFSINNDIKENMVFDICKDTGLIQLQTPLPLDITNQFPHNDSVGTIWNNHTNEFINFIATFSPKNIIEIGGGSGKLAQEYIQQNNCKWTIVDKQYSGNKNTNITVINSWFDDITNFASYDTIVHSHLLEHITDPINFLKVLEEKTSQNVYHIFSVPNLYRWLKCKYTNCLNFEHTLFLTEEIIDEILAGTGFKVIKKTYFNEHSIFYGCIKTKPRPLQFKNNYVAYKKLFIDYINDIQTNVTNINNKIKSHNGPIYLFGAHIFSQILLAFGLCETKISGLLDNSTLKNQKRLYGTNFFVESPQILKNIKNAAIIVKAGVYTNEIKTDILKNINPDITFI